MALLLETHYSKDQILEAYSNEIFLGQDGDRAVHGFGLASQLYFNKTPGRAAPVGDGAPGDGGAGGLDVRPPAVTPKWP